MKKVLIALLICLSVLAICVACSSSPNKKCGIEVTITGKDSQCPATLNLYTREGKAKMPLKLLVEGIKIPAKGESVKIDLPADTYEGLWFADDTGNNRVMITPATKFEIFSFKVVEGEYTQCECDLRKQN